MLTFQDLAADYASLWDRAETRQKDQAKIAQVVAAILALRPTYESVSASTGVPWFVIGSIHSLESSLDTTKHLHNGDPLSARTTHVPRGQPASGNPPFTWVQSAVDALTTKGLHKVPAWTIERIAFELERYNGFGYRKYHPDVNSPYLWSCTDLYTRGKYTSDGKFSASTVSGQVGAMALLKQMIADGTVTCERQSGVVAKPPLPPTPVATGLFEPIGNFKLLAEPRDDAARGSRVYTGMAVTKLKEVDADWWQIEVPVPDASKLSGFARRTWLKEKFVLSTFDKGEFAEACLAAARAVGTSAHFMIALADAESGIGNVPGEPGEFGPFEMTAEDWAAFNDPAQTGYGDADRFNWRAQVAVASLMEVKLTKELQARSVERRLPTSQELFLARVAGIKGAQALLEAPDAELVRSALAASIGSGDIDRMFALHPSLLDSGTTVAGLRAKISQLLDGGLAKAVELIRDVEPSLIVGPPETTSDNDVPWMDRARSQIGVNEATGGQRITEYFAATTYGSHPPSEPWCAAFVSWCIKQAGGSPKVKKYSATAADWLGNGDKISGPEYGAIAVTRPYTPKGSGHVGFVTEWDKTMVTFLGGNQNDSVCEKRFPIADVRGWRMV